MTILELQNVSKIYENKNQKIKALDNINLKIEKGDCITFCGSKNSGKTSLFNILAGLDKPTCGKIFLNETDISAIPVEELTETRRDKIGMIFSNTSLVEYLTVLENLMVTQFYHSMSNATEAMEILDAIGIGYLAKKLPKKLSNLEKQLLCVARAFINQPQIILADEPEKNLKDEEKDSILKAIKLLHQNGQTILIFSEKQNYQNLTNKTILLEKGSIVTNFN